MSRIDELFQTLRSEGKAAFMPFITAGDPDLAYTRKLLEKLDAAGCHMIELGVPYSDPIADGPVIQASYTRALEKHVSLDAIFTMADDVVPGLRAPVVTMVSYAIIYRHGLREYVARAKKAGFSGAIVPDLLVEEADAFAEICREADFSLIQLVTPTTPRERAVKIAQSSTGFLYYVSVTGITGERTALPSELAENVGWLREQTTLPICIGFGVSRPEHVHMLKPVADGVIVGSAIVRQVAAAGEDPEKALGSIGELVAELLEAVEA